MIPSDVAGLRGWWKADAIVGLTDGQTIGTWPDSSGLGNDAVQATEANKPTYRTNGIKVLPVVRFVPNQRFGITNLNMLAMTNNAPGCTMLAYVKLANPSAVVRDILSISTGLAANSTRFKTSQRAVGGLGLWALACRRLDADAAQILDDGLTQNSFQLLTMICDWANTDAFIYRGETLQTSDDTWLTAGNSDITNSVAVTIGSRADQTAEFWEGDMAEIAVWDRVISGDNLQGMWDYFQVKYEFVAAGRHSTYHYHRRRR